VSSDVPSEEMRARANTPHRVSANCENCAKPGSRLGGRCPGAHSGEHFFQSARRLAVHYPWLPAKSLIRSRFDSVAEIGRCQGPLLQLHGDADTFIPIELGRRLFRRPRRSPGIRIRSLGTDRLSRRRRSERGRRSSRHRRPRFPTVPDRRRADARGLTGGGSRGSLGAVAPSAADDSGLVEIRFRFALHGDRHGGVPSTRVTGVAAPKSNNDAKRCASHGFPGKRVKSRRFRCVCRIAVVVVGRQCAMPHSVRK